MLTEWERSPAPMMVFVRLKMDAATPALCTFPSSGGTSSVSRMVSLGSELRLHGHYQSQRARLWVSKEKCAYSRQLTH